MTTTVYRAYDADGELLYVGYTDNPEKRVRDHARDSYWHAATTRWTFEEHPTREAAKAAEYDAIRAESPHCNVQGISGHPADCAYPGCRARFAHVGAAARPQGISDEAWARVERTRAHRAAAVRREREMPPEAQARREETRRAASRRYYLRTKARSASTPPAAEGADRATP